MNYYNTNISLYIPDLPKDTSKVYIMDFFHNFKYGWVKRVDFVKNKNSNTTKKAFIHFDVWYLSDNTSMLYYYLLDLNRYAYIQYSDNKYWTIAKCLNPKISNHEIKDDKILSLESITDYMYDKYEEHIKEYYNEIENIRTDLRDINNKLQNNKLNLNYDNIEDDLIHSIDDILETIPDNIESFDYNNSNDNDTVLSPNYKYCNYYNYSYEDR